MTKYLILPFILASALLTFSASAQEKQTDSLNHLLKDQQLAQYCAMSGNKTNTRIKISLPTGDFFYGSIICNVETNS